ATPPPGGATPPPGGATPPPGGPPALASPPGIQYQPLEKGSGVSNTIGNIALISAILGFCCVPLAGGILGIVFGRIGMDRAKRGLATNGGVAKAGFWLGVAGLVFAVLGLIVAIISSAMNTSSGA
ncbi:MAG: DUF4190 domain-containing protein, partial [Actinobacteria bacterium]|nr:DUF4190 domain-containing protein [Actinomycetota bacterium]